MGSPADNSSMQSPPGLGQTASLDPRRHVSVAADVQKPAYFHVFDGQIAYRFELPRSGEVVIGRAPEVQLRLDDGSASRQHARLDIACDAVWLTDLGSRNGTRVNGDLLVEPRALLSGDVVTICSATLVFGRTARQQPVHPLYEASQLRQRLHEEADRCRLYQRTLSIICLRFASTDNRQDIVAQLVPQLRAMDIIGWLTSHDLAVILPELTAASAHAQATALWLKLKTWGDQIRIGLVTLPDDGTDIEALLTTCQSAAAVATNPGIPSSAPETTTVMEIGGMSVLLAEPSMKRMYALIEKLAKTDLPVLIEGETGVGKEAAARALHQLSSRGKRPLQILNCAALSETLVDSELFGHDRGAYSGAHSSKAGLLECAEGGTVILDEVGELSPSIQAKLLRVLETKQLRRVGETKERSIDVRVVAVTNRDLHAEVLSGRFRKDLFFRLSSARLTLPPLRERPRELPILARHLLASACEAQGRGAMGISPPALHLMLSYKWPGNVRELRSVLRFAAATIEEDTIQLSHIDPLLRFEDVRNSPSVYRENATTGSVSSNREIQTDHVYSEADVPQKNPTEARTLPHSFSPIEQELRELERNRMLEALSVAGGVQVRAAELLSMPARTFTAKMKQYNLSLGRASTRKKDGSP